MKQATQSGRSHGRGYSSKKACLTHTGKAGLLQVCCTRVDLHPLDLAKHRVSAGCRCVRRAIRPRQWSILQRCKHRCGRARNRRCAAPTGRDRTDRSTVQLRHAGRCPTRGADRRCKRTTNPRPRRWIDFDVSRVQPPPTARRSHHVPRCQLLGPWRSRRGEPLAKGRSLGLPSKIGSNGTNCCSHSKARLSGSGISGPTNFPRVMLDPFRSSSGERE